MNEPTLLHLLSEHLLPLSLSVVLCLLTACGPGLPTASPQMAATATPTAIATLRPPYTATPMPSVEPPDAIQAVLWQLTGQFRVHLDGVRLVRWERVDWSDGCLSIPMRAACTEAIVPGYRIVVEIAGQQYEYRSTLPDADAYRLLLAVGPETGIEEPALVWENWEDNGCQSLILAGNGRAAIGPCDAPHAPLRLFDDVERPQQWADLLARFAPFEAETPSGWVKFQGEGQELAGPAWQRAVAAWARLVRQELQFGRSGASWGTALGWHREMPERPGYCQFLQIEVYGLAYAATARCEGEDAQNLAQGWLERTEWEQFDAWFYSRQSVHRQDLDFFSAGTQEMSESEVEALWGWGEAVYGRLANQTSSAVAPSPEPALAMSVYFTPPAPVVSLAADPQHRRAAYALLLNDTLYGATDHGHT